MAFGKTERMAAVIIGIVALAVAVHFLIFQKKAQVYDQTSQDYKAAVEQLSTAELIGEQQAAFEQYKNRTSEYSDLVTSVVNDLNLVKLDLSTSPPLGAVDQWGSGTIALLTRLTAPPPANLRLSFLGKDGWDLSAQLPDVGGAGALADRVSQLNGTYQELQVAKGNVNAELQVLRSYNSRLTALGLNPQQISNFYYNAGGVLFFDSEEWIKTVLSASTTGGMQGGDLRPYYNPYSVQRFGQSIPSLKKIWTYALVRQALETQSPDTVRLDPNILPKFGEALQIGLPFDNGEPLNSINKQLAALLDIIAIAGQAGVQEISQVRFLRPVNVPKATIRVPGATPPATPAPAPTAAGGMGMGMDMGMGMGAGIPNQPIVTPIPDAERVGTGAGVELVLRADNASLTRFYYQISHVTRTYGIDDLYVYNTPQGMFTTATVEVITDVNLQAAAGAPPI